MIRFFWFVESLYYAIGYMITSVDNNHHTLWKKRVQGVGATFPEIYNFYKNNGYNVNRFEYSEGTPPRREALNWMMDEIALGRTVQIGWRAPGPHNSIIKRVQFNSTTLQMNLTIMNPSSLPNASRRQGTFDRIFLIYSVWPK